MDAAGVERAAIMGFSEGGSLAVLLAAVHPERCSALVLYGAFARFSHWFPTTQKLEAFLDYVETSWGTGESFTAFAPSKKGNMEFKKWWGRWKRHGGSPSAVVSLMRLNSGINIDGILLTLRVPTLVLHRTEDPTVSIQAGRFLAKNIPRATLIELEGVDHMCWFGDNATQIADTILDFMREPGGDARSTVTSRRFWRPSCSRILSARPSGLNNWATGVGGSCFKLMMQPFGGRFCVFAAARSNPLATVSWPTSMVRRAPSVAPWRSR